MASKPIQNRYDMVFTAPKFSHTSSWPYKFIDLILGINKVLLLLNELVLAGVYSVT